MPWKYGQKQNNGPFYYAHYMMFNEIFKKLQALKDLKWCYRYPSSLC